MSDGIELTGLRFRAGVFRGQLDTHGLASAPSVSLHLHGEAVAEANLSRAAPGVYDLRAVAPVGAFGEGVSVIRFVLDDGTVLATYPVAAGAALAGDLASEVASLRAEIDQLKAAIRGVLTGGVITRAERPIIVAEALEQFEMLQETRARSRARAVDAGEAADIADEEELVPWDDDEELDDDLPSRPDGTAGPRNEG